MNRFEARAVQRMWRNKDKEAIKDHTARVLGDKSQEAVQDAPGVIVQFPVKR